MEDEDGVLGDDLYGDIKLPPGTAAETPLAVGVIPDEQPQQFHEFARPGCSDGDNHHRKKRRPTSSSSHPKSLTDQVDELQKTVDRLQAENETLRRNMGTLFRTATAELARKDRQLQEARQQQQQQHVTTQD